MREVARAPRARRRVAFARDDAGGHRGVRRLPLDRPADPALRQPEHDLGRGAVRLAPRLRHRRSRSAWTSARPTSIAPAACCSGATTRRRRTWRRRRPSPRRGARRGADRGRSAPRGRWRPARISGCACGPGTDGALALGLAARHDRARAGTIATSSATGRTGAFLVRDDTGRFLTARRSLRDRQPRALRGLGSRGGPAGGVRSGRRRLHRADRRSAARRDRACTTRSGPSRAGPRSRRYAALCREYPPERVEPITGVPAAQIVETARLLWERRPVSYFHWTGLEQHTNATQTVRALSLLYALTGCFDAPGGNVRPSRPPVNDLAPLSLLPERQRAKALGLAERPLGPAPPGLGRPRPTSTARCSTARPTRCAGMVGFGTNLLLSAPGAATARAALTQPRLPGLRRSVPDAHRRARRRGAAGVHRVGARGAARGLRADAGRRAARAAPARGGGAAGRGALGHWIVCELARAAGPGRAVLGRRRGRGPSLRARADRRHARAAPRRRRGGVRDHASSRASSATRPAAPTARSASPTPSRRVEIYSAQLPASTARRRCPSTSSPRRAR